MPSSRFVCVLAIAAGGVGCLDVAGGDPAGESDVAAAKSYALAPTWSLAHVGPATGFVSKVAFAPGSSTVAWISGDDTSGLYRSLDGGTRLAPVSSAPVDAAAYGLAFGPGARVIAPNHFGRGVAISDDGGATWRVATAGIPQGAADLRRIHDVVVGPAGDILLGTGSGLYRSVDGATFTQVTAGLATALAITRIVRTPVGLIAGSGNGRLYQSADGARWVELSTADGAAVSDLAVGAQGLYVATYGGLIVRLGSAGVTVIANPVLDPRFATALWTKLAVAPLGAVDRIYAGVVGTRADRTASRLLVSDDGGATFAARGAGLAGASVFSLAVDPADPAHVLLGTVGDGAFVTRSAGAAWAPIAGDLRASSAIGFAQDPADPEHWLMTSTESLVATPSLLERRLTGWTRQPALVEDGGALAFAGATLVAGGFATGAPARIAASAAGPWIAEPTPAGKTLRLVTTARGLYAAGATLARRDATGWRGLGLPAINDLAEAPAGAGGALVACGMGMYASATGAFTDAIALPAPPRGWWSCRFDAAGRLYATGSGELWTAASLTAATTAAGWQRIATPLDGAELVSALPLGDQLWLGGGAVDIGASIGARSGLYRSADGGRTWIAMHGAMWPSHTVWQLHAGRDARELFVALWGGGLWRATLR